MNGTLYGCGNNEKGQLGIGKNSNEFKFVKICDEVKRAYASSDFTMIQKVDDTIHFTGQCPSMGFNTNKFVHIKIENVKSFGCGKDFALFLRNNNEVFGLGSNKFGQMGSPIIKGEIKERPFFVHKFPSDSLICGTYHTFFLTKKGFYGCGKNNDGRLGIGNTLDQNEPVYVKANFASLHCGGSHTFYITKNGELFETGNNDSGQLFTGNKQNVLRFQKVEGSFKHITTGFNHTLYLNNKNEVFSCGSNTFGQLGLGDKADRTKPVNLSFPSVKLIHQFQLPKIEWSSNNHSTCFPTNFKNVVLTIVLCLQFISDHSDLKKIPSAAIISLCSLYSSQYSPKKKTKVSFIPPKNKITISFKENKTEQIKPIEDEVDGKTDIEENDQKNNFSKNLLYISNYESVENEQVDEITTNKNNEVIKEEIQLKEIRDGEIKNDENETKEEVEKQIVAPKWMDDLESGICLSCKSSFSFWNRRHHCRMCGGLYCYYCSSKTKVIHNISSSPVRVCNDCFSK
eukprot:TRINITY_DN2604_c0_g1_i1.p1 TRINITY_DN2604_c0_g1~~TRINITY_DN2604_c0_g1_i1.p1  ORF type:complete len:589 (-),score=128.00 TRINITY_DN2604_c0_g1_i1:13-1551(-)